MKKLLPILFIIAIFCACSPKAIMPLGQTNNCFFVKKIKAQDSIFIIYAQRNDTIFKIVSKEERVLESGYKKVKQGKYYTFDLQTVFPKTLLGTKMPRPGGGGATGFNFWGVPVSIEPQKGIWDLFYAKNLKGLYIKEENQ